MKKYVIVATRGRALETAGLFDFLLDQDARPDAVYVVGSEAADLPDVSSHPLLAHAQVEIMVSPLAGSTCQRNAGIEALLREVDREQDQQRWFAAFLDDDFRPDHAWLRQCEALFAGAPDVVGMSGQILADGAGGHGLADDDARAYLSGARRPDPHWSSGNRRREVGVVYGCNMGFVDRVVRACRFDEALPLYGWQDDHDYTSQARRFGRTVYEPTCRGVHLGVKKGRVSGLRFGYSQIANPLYLARKRTMARKRACAFVTRHLLSNLYHSVHGDPVFDYRGRLRGNFLAFADIMKGVSHPARVLDLP